jgi:cytochrome c-type biogenesis protein CcmH
MSREVYISVLLLLIAVSIVAAAQKPKMEEVASKLSCFCGTCPHLVVTQCGCSAADRIMAEVQKKIDAGMTESQILDSFVAEYGATVLAAPPKKGFDLTAWLLPFFAFFVGAGVLVTYLKRQRGEEGKSESPTTEDNRSKDEKEYRERLERELEDRK